MEINYYLRAEFDAVYLLNGAFCEGGSFSYSSSEALYITVLPLDAMLIPFTAKILGDETISNSDFCKVYSVGELDRVICLKPRYNYVYAPKHKPSPASLSPPMQLFSLLKAKDVFAARALLSKELNASIDDDSLFSFFDDYIDIIENSVDSSSVNSYFLIKPDNSADLVTFYFQANKIDNISSN